MYLYPTDPALDMNTDPQTQTEAKENGAHVNSVNGETHSEALSATLSSENDIPATKLLAEFVADANPKLVTPALREKLKEVIIDYIGVTVSGCKTAPSSDSIYKAILSLGAATGSCTVLTKGHNFTPQYAALLNATFGHSLDFDDTYAEGTLHAGVTVISAALAQAETRTCSSDELLTSIAIGYEVTCRLGRELGYAAYSQGFHNTSTAGIFGAVATVSYLRHLDAQTIRMAFGLAGSKAAGSMQYLENGSWNKRLHPGFAAHDAFTCVALASAGVIGAEKIIEGNLGFLHAYSPNPSKSLTRLTSSLGKTWAWESSSLKPYPACRMTHGFIEMAGTLASHLETSDPETRLQAVQRITLFLSASNHILVGRPTPNKIHPANIVDAQFSAYFQTANAWLYGSNTGAQAYTRLDDARIHQLCDRISVSIDEAMGGMGCRIRVEYADDGDGSKKSVDDEKLMEPLGEVSHPFTRDQINEKFESLMVPVYGEEVTKKVRRMVDSIEDHRIEDILALLV